MRMFTGIHALAFFGLVSVSGCVTAKTPLQPSQYVDDGVDYYSAQIDNDDGNLIYTEQWIEDENGDRIYTLNSHQRVGTNRLYVGDIRTLSNSATEPNRPPELNRNGEAIPRVSVLGGRSVIDRSDGGFNRGYNSPYGYRSSPVFINPPQPASDNDQTADTPPAPQPVRPPTPAANPTTTSGSRSGQNRARHRRALLRTQPKIPTPKQSPSQSTD